MLPAAVLALALAFPHVTSSVAFLVTRTHENPTEIATTCSATILTDKLILTEAHCVPDAARIFVDDIEADVVVTQHDLVVLRPRQWKSSWRSIPVRRGGVEIGEPVFAFGFAFGEFLAATEGRVAGFNPTDADPLWMDLEVVGGMSGGPIVDSYGQLVTLVRCTRSDTFGSPSGFAGAASLNQVKSVVGLAKTIRKK